MGRAKNEARNSIFLKMGSSWAWPALGLEPSSNSSDQTKPKMGLGFLKTLVLIDQMFCFKQNYHKCKSLIFIYFLL